LDKALWEDSERIDSDHDFGKNILPSLVKAGKKVIAYPFDGYWVDVGTVDSYWQAHMDLLREPPPFDLGNRSWIIHTRTEERPPARIANGAKVIDSMIADGCKIAEGAIIERSVLGPGVVIGPGVQIRESVILTDARIEAGAILERTIADKRVLVKENAHIGRMGNEKKPVITTLGKTCVVPVNRSVGAGALVGPDVAESDFEGKDVAEGGILLTKRLPYEI
jgi:glucose-1-phosphate adenylyltransferase